MDKRIKDLEPEDLRLMIGQNIGLRYLIPLAIELLKEDPLIETNFFEGDLLLKVLGIEKKFWCDYPKMKIELLSLFKNKLINYDALDDEDIKLEIYSAYEELKD